MNPPQAESPSVQPPGSRSLVFISYSTKDKLTADAVCATLEAQGIRCWIAPRDVIPGEDWGEAIIDAISASGVMVLVFSSNANASPQVRREVQRAFERDVTVIPFRVENVQPARALEYYIGPVHWMDAMTPPLEQHLQRLARSVKLLLADQDMEAGGGLLEAGGGLDAGGGRPDAGSEKIGSPALSFPASSLSPPTSSSPPPASNPPPSPSPLVATQPPTQVRATASLVMGLASIPASFACFPLGALGGITALGLGVWELMAIKAGQSSPSNRGMAIGGVVTGGLALLGAIFWFVLTVLVTLLPTGQQ
jgi:TIR domain-containing protein